MIVDVDPDGVVALRDASDFARFKVRLAADPTSASGLRFEGTETAWVSIAALGAMPGAPGGVAWHEGLAAMVAKARPHGWISTDGGEILAHVERPAA